MKKVIAKTLILVSVLSFAMVYSPTALQVDVVSAATGQTTPVKTTPVPVPKITAGSQVYIVVKGDMMWKIARKYNLTLAQLSALNPQIKNLNLIYVGQKIIVGQAVSTPTTPTTPVVVPGTGVDTVSAASITDNAAVFEKSIGKDGKWIICTTKDLVINKELVLEGEFKNGKKDADGNDVIQRKIALYTQDDKRNITARFTLTAPKLTILSPEASIQHGTFKGDLYVSVKNFKLVDTKVEGNVYFTTEEAKTTFIIDDKSSVTGKQELIAGVDTVASASITDNAAVFEKSIGKDGKWIICTTKDLVIKNPLVLEGEFKNGKKDANGNDIIQRKIALYTQDDKRNITARFTLTAPKLTILSPEASIQHGTFIGDLYVIAENFQLVDTKVEGNVYFASEKAKATFKADDKSSVTGKQELITIVDAVASASITDNAAVFEKSIGKDGKWIICTTKDLVIKNPLVLEGEFKNGKKDANGNDIIQRKIALYTQDDKRNITARFTLTAPKLTILSPMASIQHGTFIGDLYVSAENFQLVDTKVEGNVYFTSEKAKATFKADDKSSVTGKQELIQVDAVTTASLVETSTAFKHAISKEGTWIAATLNDLVFDQNLVLEGTFKNGKKDANGNDIIQRKIGLYTQDDKRNVTARFSLTAPALTILSPMASIQHGTFIGDLYVSAENFQLVDTKVIGNIYFISEQAKATFKLDDKSSITGEQIVIK